MNVQPPVRAGATDDCDEPVPGPVPYVESWAAAGEIAAHTIAASAPDHARDWRVIVASVRHDDRVAGSQIHWHGAADRVFVVEGDGLRAHGRAPENPDVLGVGEVLQAARDGERLQAP